MRDTPDFVEGFLRKLRQTKTNEEFLQNIVADSKRYVTTK
jgi:transcription termination factor Rho